MTSTHAAENARAIACLIRSQPDLPDRTDAPDEESLFLAMHACMHQVQRVDRQKSHTRAQRNRWFNRWTTIRRYIVEHNMGLIYSMLGRFKVGLPDHELLSDAQLALVHAVDRFNPTKGYKFSTYACSAIAYALMYRGRKQDRLRRRFPVRHDETLDAPIDSSDNGQQLYVERLHYTLRNNLAELSDLETRILHDRFPFDASPRMTLRELGGKLGISKERVRQIQNRALRKLRDVLRDDPVLQ